MEKWILDAQGKFKAYKRNEKLIGDCIEQTFDAVTNTHKEVWQLYPRDLAAVPGTYELYASRFATKVYQPDGKMVSITELY